MKKIKFLFLIFFTINSSFLYAVELKVHEWEGYISPFAQDFKKYAKSKGMDVDLIFIKPDITSPDQLFKMVRLGKTDVVTPTHNYYKMDRNKLIHTLQPIDFTKLKNYANLISSAIAVPFDSHEGKKYSVPLLGGSYGLAYNTQKVKEPKSWNVLWDPKNKGKISITKEQFEANLYITILSEGYDPEDCYEIHKGNVDLQKIKSKLNRLVENTGPFWAGIPSVEDMKELSYVTDYWFGVALANKNGQKWKVANPKEGQTVWLDTMAISRSLSGDKLKAAYLLLDFMISPEVQKRIHEMYGSVIVNLKAANIMSKKQIESSYLNNQSFFKEEFFWKPLPVRTRNNYKIMWEEALENVGKR